ncbi:MAG TPA: LacI family DNA-binding transcriptional regulator [Devosiaceae bacterium]|jgi:LacI family transcriptional regulator
MARKVTLDDLSRQLNLSKFSISRALSGRPGVSEQTREAVLRAARELGYEHAATAVAPSEKLIHLVIPQADAMHSSFWVEVIGGAEAEARTMGYRLTVDVLSSDRGTEVLGESVHGLLLAGRRSRGVIEPFMQLPLPKVLIGHPRPMELVDSVQAANFDGGYSVGDMLGRLGHRRIAFFSDALEDEGRNLRQAGLAEAMRIHGGEVLPPFPFDESRDAKAMVLEALLSPHRPTAFAGATDFVAITLAWGVMELGLRVPQHVSIVGSNDSQTASQLGLKMTTVRQPMHEIGAAAMQMLQWRLEKAAPDARPRRTLLTPEFVERATHGPCNEEELGRALDLVQPSAADRPAAQTHKIAR